MDRPTSCCEGGSCSTTRTALRTGALAAFVGAVGLSAGTAAQAAAQPAPPPAPKIALPENVKLPAGLVLPPEIDDLARDVLPPSVFGPGSSDLPGIKKAVKPVSGTVTSGYGPRWGTHHNGVDIANKIGTPIYAVTDGVVLESGPASGFSAAEPAGNMQAVERQHAALLRVEPVEFFRFGAFRHGKDAGGIGPQQKLCRQTSHYDVVVSRSGSNSPGYYIGRRRAWGGRCRSRRRAALRTGSPEHAGRQYRARHIGYGRNRNDFFRIGGRKSQCNRPIITLQARPEDCREEGSFVTFMFRDHEHHVECGHPG